MTQSADGLFCPACLGADIGAASVGWATCGHCGSQFLLPALSVAENTRLALASSTGEEDASDVDVGLFELVKRFDLPRGASILDVRCQGGERLERVAGLGLKLFAIEGDPALFQHAAKRLGNEAAIASSFAGIVPHKFELVLLIGVLDRVFDPAEILYALFSLGAIVADTRIVLTVARARDDGNAIDNAPGTRSRYTPEGLRLFLERLQFTVDHRAENATHLTAIASGSEFAAFMQERYVPGTWSKLAEYEHFPRYQLALMACAGKRVLDFGSGTGYGTALLSSVALSALGVDIDAKAIAWARTTHRNTNLTFDLRDDFAAGLPAASFDVITCFEMIEHVNHEDQIRTIESLGRLLREDGVLFMSTPNPEITAQYGANPFHLREMTKAEFTQLLEGAFRYIDMQDQAVMSAVTITPKEQGHWSALQSSFLSPVNRVAPMAFIARASHTPLPESADRVMFDRGVDIVQNFLESEKALNQLKFQAYQLREELSDCEARWRAGRGPRESPDIPSEQVAVLRAQVAVLRAQVAVLRGQLEASRRQYTNVHRRLAAFHASRVFLLGRALREKPRSLSKLMLALRLALGIILPESWVKSLSRNRPVIDPGTHTPRKKARAASKITAAEAYVVKIPDVSDTTRPRVLHAIANVMTGGSTRLVVDLLEHLGGLYEQKVLTGFVPDPPSYHPLPVIEVPEPVPPFEMDSVIESFKPDLVHVHYWGDVDEPWYASVFEAAIAAGVPIIQNINTPVDPYRARAATNVFVSEYVHRIFGGSDPKAHVVYPGSDLAHFSRSAGEPVPDDCVGMVYRLEHDKLNEGSIEPFIEIVRRRPQTKALIIGGGLLLDAYRARVASAGLTNSFEFKGYVSYAELPALYRRLSIFIAPVWKESFGQVTPFAMNMEIPVIGYDVGAISEIVDDATLIAAPGDAPALAQIAIDLLDDRARRLDIGRRNKARAESIFSIESMIDRYRTVYAEALQRTRA